MNYTATFIEMFERERDGWIWAGGTRLEAKGLNFLANLYGFVLPYRPQSVVDAAIPINQSFSEL
jgi:hypothetical protein